MTVDQIFQQITKQIPPIIYIGGKTSTGKSTFARKLHKDLNYQVVELEAVLLRVVNDLELDQNLVFDNVFYKSEEKYEKNYFYNLTDHIISDSIKSNHRLVIEGAVSNVYTLKRVLKPASNNLLFLYFHPYSIDIYIRNLTDRFKTSIEIPYAGLPQKFWHLIDKNEYEKFLLNKVITKNISNSIKQYAQSSQKESMERIETYQSVFNDIHVIEIQ